ncbi:hypothetical protein [Methylobacterium sp. 391_Methyba4]|uniref:hypothetical protein n=1 Tax=Methylobacterium sp. 391_Methyba4 TaxID=3038924 RepID=UPI00241FD0E4|nr:hypothetical protein [Methylobacterium sp. 391_Methyba4]WFS07630.1 hypothetical protein P9K36_30495 [Methylobacterium sp. 391_Methyba4]
MAFAFTDVQWATLSEVIVRVGGHATDYVRGQLEADVARYLGSINNDAEITAALRRVSAEAHALNKSLRDLARACLKEELVGAKRRPGVIANDVKERLKFARQVRECAEGADFSLDKGYRAFNDARRGRPPDTTLLVWATALLRLARQERWNVEDSRGRTSAALTDLMFELSRCAQTARISQGHVRRALTRALAQAMTEQRVEAGGAERLYSELDALCGPEPKMPEHSAIYLRSSPPKSD